ALSESAATIVSTSFHSDGRALVLFWSGSQEAWGRMYAVEGGCLWEGRIVPGQMEIPLSSSLPVGLYYLQIREGERILQKPVVKLP
ncbi:MAG: hypothetical protein N2170_06380, partial [Bacteroidia bacterium]|nr:hypothetical protein [Bacteroidia bacterium]